MWSPPVLFILWRYVEDRCIEILFQRSRVYRLHKWKNLGDMCFRAFGEARVNKNHRDIMEQKIEMLQSPTSRLTRMDPKSQGGQKLWTKTSSYRHDIQYQNKEKEEELAYLASGFNPLERSLVKMNHFPNYWGENKRYLKRPPSNPCFSRILLGTPGMHVVREWANGVQSPSKHIAWFLFCYSHYIACHLEWDTWSHQRNRNT